MMPQSLAADQILAGLPDPLIVVNRNNQIDRVNPAAENLFRTSAKKMTNQPLDSVLQFQDQRLRETLSDPDANMVAHSAKLICRGQANAINCYVNISAFTRDWRLISMRLRSESLDAGDSDLKSKDRMGVRAPDILGHEIKNPLAAIRGAAQLLERKSTDQEKVHTGMIIYEVDRIARLIERMQNLSTNQPANLVPINVHSLINQSKQTLETGIGKKVQIVDDFDPSLPMVLADADSMMQILSNLLSNAVEAVEPIDDPKIEIMTRFSFGGVYSTEGPEKPIKLPIEVIIRDNGPGVPRHLSDEIFSPFVTSKPQGQGLGLALTKKLVNDMNGRVRYNRLVDVGLTQFTLFLPMDEES